jgi:alpha-mannosidase
LVSGFFRHPMFASGKSFACVDRNNVIIDTIKGADNENAVIIRLFECFNQRGHVILTLCRTPKRVTECNLLERNDQKITWKENTIQFYITPYEIRTFKITF